MVPALSLFNITMTLAQAIGLLVLGRIVATIFPPFTLSLGALMLHVHSIDMLFVVVAFFYFVCAVLILSIAPQAFHEEHIDKSRTSSRVSSVWDILRHDVVDGWRFVRNDRLLFFSVFQLSAMGVIVLLIGEFAGTFVQQILHRPVEDMSLIFMPAAVGLIGAALLMPNSAERVEKMRLTVIGFIVASLGIFLLPLPPWLLLHLDPAHGLQSPLVTCATTCLTFLIGTAIACITVPTQIVLQERSPETVRGRVFAFQSMVYNTGSIPVLLFAGIIGQFIGLNQLIVLVTASMLLFCWWGTRFRKLPAKSWG